MNLRRRLCQLPICLLLMLCFISGTARVVCSAAYEQPTDVSAGTILTPDQLKGPYHTVDDRVQYDGLFYRFSVSSPFGNFQADSMTQLKILIHELGAIAVMKNVKTDDTAVQSVEKTGEKTVTGLKNLFTKPVATLGGAAEGVGDLFTRASETIGQRDTTETEDSKFAQVVGFTKSKGQIATRFGVSIYTRNSVLQSELDRLAMADYLGGIGVGLATSVIPGVGGLILTTSGTARLLNEAINNTPPSKLWVQNKNKLTSMGFDSDTVELFLNNPVFTPAHETVLVNALEVMAGAVNRGIFIKIGLQASNPDMALFVTEAAVLYAGYYKNISPITGFNRMGRLVKGFKEDGTTVVILPTDHLIWSERVAGVVEELSAADPAKGAGFELWTMGTLSHRAKSELLSKKWKVQENVSSKLIPSHDPSN
jgi:hypothetical protein